jgi:rod shape determining protein RodA
MLLAVGIVAMLFFHVFVNIGMTIGLMPVKGLPLPLLSYGGSFVLASMAALGLLQNIWIHRRVY